MTEAIREAAKQIGFVRSSDALTEGFLRTLVASRPGDKFSELRIGPAFAFHHTYLDRFIGVMVCQKGSLTWR